MNYPQETLDELIFDYLEGNLEAEEKEAFELLMRENDMVHWQVKLWRNTYVEEPLPVIDELERKLAISNDTSTITGMARRLFMNTLLVLLVFLPVSQKF
jgi:hypothetical protein